MASVARGIAVLMERGFSRERATAVLLREMQRNNGEAGSSSSSAPNDQEVSDTMLDYWDGGGVLNWRRGDHGGLSS